MGRPRWSDRLLTEECLSLDTLEFTRAGVFRIGPGAFGTCQCRVGSMEAVFSFSLIADRNNELFLQIRYPMADITSRTAALHYAIQVTTTHSYFGGWRFWFACPLVREGLPCRRQVRKLYLPLGGRYFGCRTCYNLTYRSAREHDKRVNSLLRLPLGELKDELARALQSDKMARRWMAFNAINLLVRRLNRLAGR